MTETDEPRGHFEEYEPGEEPCPECSGPTECARWHRVEGGVVDVRVVCRAQCGWEQWYEGVNEPPEEAHSLRVRGTDYTWRDRYVQRVAGEK